ncbi:regulator of (H+)-ATPase in vacuolar membrane [Chytridiales sp. JEL 0842]|nr:regulator of (H+)-ATPase in vacuolar membrane [Chytridiales sp. JEL 0842]
MQNDPFIKIWYLSKRCDPSARRYDFLYLKHPKPVINFEWRRTRPSRLAILGQVGNVLLSQAKDSIARIWNQSSLSAPYLFEMQAVIDPRQSPGMYDLSGRGSVASINSTLHRRERQAEDSVPRVPSSASVAAPQTIDNNHLIVHWLCSEEIENAVEYRDKLEDKLVKKKRKSATSIKRSKKLRDTIRDYPDMVFCITQDGSLAIWGIQYLDGKPKRIPKVLTILKSEAAVLPADFDFFRGRIQVFHDKSRLDRSSIYFPAEVQLIAQSPSGIFAIYTMNLDDFFGSSWTNAYMRLENTWTGHASSAKSIIRHSTLPLVAVVNQMGGVNLYRASVPQTAVRVTDGLDLVASLPSIGKDVMVAWIPTLPIMILQSGGSLTLEKVETYGASHLATLDGSKMKGDLRLLNVYYDQACNDDNSSERNYHLVAITSAGEVLVWTLVFNGSNFVGGEFVSLTKLPNLDSEVIKAMPLDAVSSWMALDAPLGSVMFSTYSTGNKMTFWNYSKQSIRESLQTAVQGQEDIWVEIGSYEAPIASTPTGSTVSVLKNKAIGFGYTVEWTAKLDTTIIAAETHLTADGQELLALSTSKGVDIYCHSRIEDANDNFRWIRISECVMPWDDTVKSVCWLADGALILALETKLAVFTKWLCERTGFDNSTPNSIHTVVAYKNGRLPDYHPQFLVHNLLWGKHDLVTYLLSLLHKFVKLMNESDRIISDVPSALWKWFDGKAEGSSVKNNYDDLFGTGVDSFNADEEIGEFNKARSDYLADALTRITLPGMSKLDQMKLVALMDAFVQVHQQKRALDENGVRYVLFARLFVFSQSSFPPELKPVSLQSRDITWGFYSESQDNLIDFLNQSYGGKPLWKDAKSLGMGFWLRNSDALKRQMETIARNEYMSKDDKNPVDCSLFYMALKKKNVLLGLWKLANSHPEQGAMLKFLSNDFAEDRWQKAAIKNAYALLGKQRYEYAVAFFLLGDKLKDAVSVCLKQLGDVQLAIIICRLYEGDEGPVLKEILQNQVLPDAVSKGDRWLCSMIFTLLKQKEKALLATIMPMSTLLENLSIESEENKQTSELSDPPLFALYSYLRKHYKSIRMELPTVSIIDEGEFIVRSAMTYELMGCPSLALDILRTSSDIVNRALEEKTSSLYAPKKAKVAELISIDQSKPSNDKADAFDWSQPSQAVSDTSTSIDWSKPICENPVVDKSSAFDWSQPVSAKAEAPSSFDWSQPVASQNTQSSTFDWSEPISSGLDWGAPTAKPSSGLDDDYEAFKKSLLGDTADEVKFDDELDLLDVENSGTKDEEKEKDENITEVHSSPTDPLVLLHISAEQKKLRSYMWTLAMKIMQPICRSAACVSLNYDILQKDATLKDYFDLILEGLKTLGSLCQLPPKVLDRLLTCRCLEIDAVVAFVELQQLTDVDFRNTDAFSTFLIEECTYLSQVTFVNDDVFDNADMLYLLDIARWYEKKNTIAEKPIPLSVVSQSAACAFVTLTVASINRKDFKSLWWLAGMCDRFFEVLVGGAKKNSLKPLIVDLLIQREPTIPPDSESDSDSIDFIEDYNKELQVQSLAESLLLALTLQHVGVDLAVFVTHLKEGGNVDESYGFLTELVLKRTSKMLYGHQNNIKERWKKGPTFKPRKISNYLTQKHGKAIWSLMKRTANVSKMTELILPTEAEIEEQKAADKHSLEASNTVEDPAAGEEPETQKSKKPHSESKGSTKPVQLQDNYGLVFRLKDIIVSFAANPLDSNNIAVSTHDRIIEVDVENAMHFFERRGSFSEKRESVDDMSLKLPSKEINASLFLEVPNSKKDKVPRNLSYDSLQKAVKKSMSDLRRQGSFDLDSGQRIQRAVAGVSAVEAHPNLNYYLAGSLESQTSEAVVRLYQFGQPKELLKYTTGSTARITKCRFDKFGARLGATDSKGNLHLWKFDASQQALKPSQVLKCHSVAANDFTFLNSSTILATAGVSNSGQNVSIWDTLMPTSKAKVKGFAVAENGAHSIVYSPRQQIMACGSKKGDIYKEHYGKPYTPMKVIKANVAIQIWDINSLDTKGSDYNQDGLSHREWLVNHGERSTGVSNYGVMQINIINGTIYMCGADGCLRRSQH